jgi:micrococcal nuclease
MLEKELYTYKATVERCVDGDTIILNIDLGCGMWLHGERCRLAGIDAPETWRNPQPGGKEATEWLRDQIGAAGGNVIVKTQKGGERYGRWIIHVFIPGVEESLNEQMMKAGLAKRYEG